MIPGMSAVVALTRELSQAFADCQLTHLSRTPIDIALAVAQHAEYERTLAGLGCSVRRIGASGAMPDSVFIEDIAVVLPELAVVTRPGAESRRVEVDGVRLALTTYREISSISAPATLDGGDVLVVGRTIFVGASRRTNSAGIAQLRDLTEPL